MWKATTENGGRQVVFIHNKSVVNRELDTESRLDLRIESGSVSDPSVTIQRTCYVCVCVRM